MPNEHINVSTILGVQFFPLPEAFLDRGQSVVLRLKVLGRVLRFGQNAIGP